MDNPRILVIDGDPKNLQILQESLEAANFRVLTAGTGEDGWKLVQSQKPDIIVSEVDTPGIDGFQLLERLHDDPAHASTPLVFLTNRSNLEDRIKSLRTGVKDYMIKPLHVKEVIARLEMILRRMERMRQNEPETARKIVGRLEEQNVEQLVENYGAEKRTGVLSVYDSLERNGEIYFRGGAVVNARLGNYRAEKAVYQMLPWDHGHYIMTLRDINVADEITVSNLGLLLQGFKRVQEREQMFKHLPGPDAVLVRTSLFKKILERRSVAPDIAGFVEMFDGKRSVSEILAAAPSGDDLKTLKRIVRLYEQGFVMTVDGRTSPVAVSPSPPPRAADGFARRSSPVEIADPQNHRAPAPPSARNDKPTVAPPAETRPATPETRPAEREPEPFSVRQTPLQQETEPRVAPPISSRNIGAGPGELGANGKDAAPAKPAQESVADSLTAACAALFAGRDTDKGHFVVLSSSEASRKRLVSMLTKGRFATRDLGGSSMEIGSIVVPGPKALEVIGMSTEQKFVQLLEEISSTLLGLVILVIGDSPTNLRYTGYLVNTLKKQVQSPYVVAVLSEAHGRKVPLDYVRYSLQMGDKEQLVEADLGDENSLGHLISQLQAPLYLKADPETNARTATAS